MDISYPGNGGIIQYWDNHTGSIMWPMGESLSIGTTTPAVSCDQWGNHSVLGQPHRQYHVTNGGITQYWDNHTGSIMWPMIQLHHNGVSWPNIILNMITICEHLFDACMIWSLVEITYGKHTVDTCLLQAELLSVRAFPFLIIIWRNQGFWHIRTCGKKKALSRAENTQSRDKAA